MQSSGDRENHLVVKPGGLDDAQVHGLLQAHLAGMHENSPPESVFALDLSGLKAPEISFYSVWDGDQLAGIGALKELDPEWGEIKSMRTHAFRTLEEPLSVFYIWQAGDLREKSSFS